jgi:hypothetical protein
MALAWDLVHKGEVLRRMGSAVGAFDSLWRQGAQQQQPVKGCRSKQATQARRPENARYDRQLQPGFSRANAPRDAGFDGGIGCPADKKGGGAADGIGAGHAFGGGFVAICFLLWYSGPIGSWSRWARKNFIQKGASV